MNKTFIAIITLATAFLSADKPNYLKVKYETELSDNERTSFFNGEQVSTAIKFEKGQRFPLKLSVLGSVASISKEGEDAIYITLERDIYAHYEGKDKCFLSLDGITYKPILELFTGQIDAGINLDDESAGFMELSLALDPR